MSPGIPPKPGGLVAKMLEQESAKWQGAAVALAEVPEVIDVSAWYEQHVALLHQFLHHALKAVASTPSRRNARLIQRLGQAHADLKQHAGRVAGEAIPAVLSRDGQHPIPFERLAEAQAKVQVLTAELTQAREEAVAVKAEEWRPAFGVMSPRQEELAIQFCQEIAGLRGEPGRLPDPVRLLEMAQALYEAERESLGLSVAPRNTP